MATSRSNTICGNYEGLPILLNGTYFCRKQSSMEIVCEIKHGFDVSIICFVHIDEMLPYFWRAEDEKMPQSIIITEAIQTRFGRKCVLQAAFYLSRFNYANANLNYSSNDGITPVLH